MATAKTQDRSITDYHAKYFAYELTKRCPSDSLEKISSTEKHHGLPEIMRGFKTFSPRHINEKLTYRNRFHGRNRIMIVSFETNRN